MKITGAQALIESMLNEGVDTIFGYPGGAIMPTFDALYDYENKVNHILTRHAHNLEQHVLRLVRGELKRGVIDLYICIIRRKLAL